MKVNLITLFLFSSFSFFLNAQHASDSTPEYIQKVEAGAKALNEAAYADCLQQYKEAFNIKQTSYLSTLRAAACAYKANDPAIYQQYLDKAFELSWDGSKQIFDQYPEFEFLKGTSFEEQIKANYQAKIKALGLNVDLMEELKAIRVTDQAQRQQMGAISKKYGWQSPQMDSLWQLQSYADSVNTQRIEEIIAEYGYPGKSLVGGSLASTAFLVIQHAAHETQLKYLDLITSAADEGEVRWSSVALLVDRVRLGQGLPQIYGSQLSTDQATGKPYFSKIEMPHKVDSLRATVGLGPLQKYADHWELKWDADAHIKFHQGQEEKANK